MSIGRAATAAAISPPCEPTMAATGPTLAARATRHCRLTSGMPSIETSCLGLPSRRDAPAARMATNGPLSGIADATRCARTVHPDLARERLSVAAVRPREDFGCDRQRNPLGGTVSEVKPDRPSHLRDERFAHPGAI